MLKPLVLAILLTVLTSLQAQYVQFYKTSNYPAKPIGGIEDARYLIESQMIYPPFELANKEPASVFVSVLVNWDGRIDTLFAEESVNSAFTTEAKRLVSLIVWEKDPIRRGKKIEPQQLKITFDAKKYSRISKKREYTPRTEGNNMVCSKSKLDKKIELIHYTSLNEYTSEKIRYPALALQRTISGTVKVEFVIEKNGKATNFNITQAVAGGCNEETIRLLKAVAWQPGLVENKPVRVKSEYSLTFMHPGNTYK